MISQHNNNISSVVIRHKSLNLTKYIKMQAHCCQSTSGNCDEWCSLPPLAKNALRKSSPSFCCCASKVSGGSNILVQMTFVELHRNITISCSSSNDDEFTYLILGEGQGNYTGGGGGGTRSNILWLCASCYKMSNSFMFVFQINK